MDRSLILVVEDNPVVRQVAEHALGKFDLDVRTAENGKAALDAVSSCRYDLIVMDVLMPEMDGLEATRLLRQSGCAVPIIGVTATGERENCLAAGMNDWFMKPTDYKLILERWLPQCLPTVTELNIASSSRIEIKLPDGRRISRDSPTEVLIAVGQDFDLDKIDLTVEQVNALCQWLTRRPPEKERALAEWLEH